MSKQTYLFYLDAFLIREISSGFRRLKNASAPVFQSHFLLLVPNLFLQTITWKPQKTISVSKKMNSQNPWTTQTKSRMRTQEQQQEQSNR